MSINSKDIAYHSLHRVSSFFTLFLKCKLGIDVVEE